MTKKQKNQSQNEEKNKPNGPVLTIQAHEEPEKLDIKEEIETINKELPLWVKMRLSLGQALPKKYKEAYENRLLEKWKKVIIKKEEKLLRQAEESKAKAIETIMMFNTVFVVEDEDGNEYTDEQLRRLTHEELIELIEYYLSELKKDVGSTI